MTLAQVYDALDASITGAGSAATIDLYTAATGQPALAGLPEVLSLFGITSSYRVTGAALSRSVNAVVLTGRATFGVPGAAQANLSAVTVRLDCTPAGDDVAFALALAVAEAGWTFPRTFPTLPDTQAAQPDGTVAYVPSFLAGLSLARPVFSGRSGEDALRLAGDLGPAGALEPYAELLGPWPLRLDGTVTLPVTPADPPEMELVAVSPSLSLSVGSTELRDVGVAISVVAGLEPEEEGASAVSTLSVGGRVYLGEGSPVVADLSTSLLASGGVWRLMAEFVPGEAKLSYGLAQVTGLFGLDPADLPLPDGFVDFGGFYVSEVEVAVRAPEGGSLLPTLQHVAVTLGSDKEWHPPIPFVRIRDVGTRWVLVTEGEAAPYIGGSVHGTFLVGEGEPRDGGSFRLAVAALIPQFVVTGELLSDDTIPIGAAFQSFFGDPGPPTPDGMEVTAFAFQADPLALTFNASAEITTGWTVPLAGNVSLELAGLSFRITVSQSSVGGGIGGTLVLHGGAPQGLPDPRFLLSAEYPGGGSASGWTFTGAMYPDSVLDLGALVTNFLGMEEAPEGLPVLAVENLFLSFSTGTGAYAVRGKVVGQWTPVVFGEQLTLSASATVDVGSPTGGAPAGRLEGTFAVNRLALMVGLDVGVPNPTYQFRIQFGDLWLQAVTGWRGTGQARHQVISVQLGGVTLGGILEYFVGLAAPTLGYRLDAPWDVLNRIELSRFLLTVDPTEGTVELTYAVDLDLVFARIGSVGVRYRRVDGEGVVEMILTGRMLDRAYTAEKPLSWDVIRDPPPAVPGQGGALVDLRYLALGQRVTIRGLDALDTVRGMLDLVEGAMQPPADSRGNPIGEGSAVVFDPTSQWLIGLDVGLLEGTVQLGLIFNDPRLYGLTVALGGERAGSLAGLRFEILYKKITDEIGMFRVELRLPEAFRHIELGEISVTLGVVVVEVYTNGNFLVDLGFPHDNDFTRAFTVEVFPFIGRGGFYFGIKDGATSTRVPAITNGTFSPVLEMGVGLAVGVGKDVTVGPLSGGLFVEVEVVFEGVLAWFNPSGAGTAPALYYWAQAVAGIHGKLYGQVDFKVIKVAVSVEAYAQAGVTLEAYRKTVFALSVRASARATVRIVFVDVDFSYAISLDASFTLGTDRAAPWLLAGGASPSSSSPHSRAEVRPAAKREPRVTREVLANAHATEVRRARRSAVTRDVVPEEAGAGGEEGYLLAWSTAASVFPDGQRAVPVILLPAFSVAEPAVGWDGTAPEREDPEYRAAFLLFAPTTGEAPPAATLLEGFLRWSIQAVTGAAGGEGATVTAGQLLLLARQMEDARTAEEGFSAATLAAFFSRSLLLQVSGDPGDGAEPQGAMAFPVPPVLALASQEGERDLATFGAVGPLYEWGAGRYASTLFPLPVPPSDPPSEDDPAAYESFASFLFRDGCLLVARAAVQAARDAMEGWAYPVTEPVSLAGIAASFPRVSVDYAVRAGDTVEAAADALGATAAELEALNHGLALALASAPPGSTVPVVLGIAPEGVAADNAAVALAPGVTLRLGTVACQAGQGDTLDGIAARFGLAGASALFRDTALADDALLLRAGASFAVPATTWSNAPAGWSATFAAAVLYVRFFGWPGIPDAEWYAQTVFDFNAAALSATADWDQPLPVGTPLRVPAALNDTDATHAANYASVPGDTLMRLGAALSLAQNFAAGEGPTAGWPAFRAGVAAGTGGVSIPASEVAILPGETVNALASRTLLHAGDVDGLLGWIGGAEVLRPLAVVPVPGVQATTAGGDTLAGIAARYGMTVADLAGRVAEVPGIFPVVADDPVVLTVSHLPVQDTDALVAAVLAGAAPAQVAGTASRWMMSGLRLPAPVEDEQGHRAATGPLAALYDLTGQQIPVPAPDPAAPDAVALEVAVTLSPSAPEAGAWVQLAASPLAFAYDNARLAAHLPAASLALSPARGPAPLPLAVPGPRTYGLDHAVLLQSPVALPIPPSGDAPLAGSASLWPLPSALRARALAGSTTPYEVVSAARGDPSGATETVPGATWATLIPFGVRRLEEADHVYALRGADTVGRQVLLEAWRYLAGSPPAGTRGFLLAAPSPDAGNPAGLAVLALEEGQTFLVQGNLSTETVRGPSQTRAVRGTVEAPVEPAESWRYFAPFAALADFARLLWEGSVVGGTGYSLGVRQADGGGIPGTAWDADGNATLYLLLVAGEQQGAAPEGRPLLPFGNCALLGPGPDLSARSFFVEAADGSETVARAVVPPGSAGFTLTLPRPPEEAGEGEDDGALRLARLFSMVTYRVEAAEGSPFAASVPGLPVVPLEEDGEHAPLSERRRAERRARSVAAAGGTERDAPPAPPEAGGFWRYDQVIPVSRLGPPSHAPAVAGLPAPADDPYRGVGGAEALPEALVSLGLADVLGNVSEDGSAASVAVPVGYTDPLLGVSGWPAVTPSYTVSREGDAVTLSVTVAPQPGAVAPSPAESAAASAGRAGRQAETWARAYFQLSQPDVTAALLTTLRQDGQGAPEPLPLPSVAPLWRFAAGGWLAARGAASLSPVRPAMAEEVPLAEVMEGWGAGAAALAAANAATPAARLFGWQPLPVPAFAAFAAGDTADSLAALPRPDGWPAPTGAAWLAMDENAAVLPLRPGAVVVIPPASVTVAAPVPPETETAPLDEVAAGVRTTAALLAADNATARGVLRGGFVFEMDGVQVTAGVTTTGGDPLVPADTFALVRQAFADAGIHETVENVAAANASRAGMLEAGATLVSTRYVAEDGETLAANATGADAATLAGLNAGVADLYDAGAMVYLGRFDDGATAPASETETLLELAQRFASPVEQVIQAAADAGVVLPAGSALVVPGAGSLPEGGAGVFVPYTVRPGDTLAAVAARFAPAPGGGSAAENLAAANQAMPGALEAGAPVPGALLVCPPARVPAGEGGTALPLSAIPALYGVSAAAFALANAGTAGLLAAGVPLVSADGGTRVTTGAHDTFNAVLGRFAAAGAQAGLTELAAANADAPLLVPGALALLPPAPVTLAASLGDGAEPFASPVFPLTAAVRLERRAALVAPGFDAAGGPVQRADTPVPAPLAPSGGGAEAPLTADDFVRAVEAALPSLRLATGRVEGREGDLWAVDFGAGGIASVSAAPGVAAPGGAAWPRVFALRPLFNDLVSRQGVEIPALRPDGTLAEETTATAFQGVDVEVWARRFLGDVDLFLTAPYAGAAFLAEGARPALEALLDAKRVLGGAVSRGLSPVLVLDDPRAGEGLAEAARLLGEELDVSLSAAYATAAVVQYDAAAETAWTAPGSALKPARLSGTATDLGGGGQDPAGARPFTLSGAKLALDQGSSFLTFLMRVSDPAHHGRVDVSLDYAVLDLEFGITPVPEVQGYEASDWISFSPPLVGEACPAALRVSLGTAPVPIPLRAYPALPVLLGQDAGPSFTGEGTPTLAEAAQWSYGLTYSHEHAEQDEVLVTAVFNLAPAPRAKRMEVQTDVAAALARYAAVADELWALLAGFADPARGVDEETLASAADTFASLAGEVAGAWEGHWPASSSQVAPRAVESGARDEEEGGGAAPVERSFGFRVRLVDRTLEDGTVVLDSLVLAAAQAQPGPVGAWPAVTARGPGGGEVALVPGEVAGGTRTYAFPAEPPVPAGTWPVLSLSWGGLPVALFQNATASLSVRRNQALLGPGGPETAEGFVYRTPVVAAAGVVAPLNGWTDPIDVTALGADVGAALQAAFDALFGGVAGQRVTVGMGFGYELVPGTSLVTYLPVGLYPDQTLGPGTAAAIAAALEAWRRANQPAAQQAEWVLSLTAYSQLGGEGARPLLVLDRMVYRIGG